jgi:hypothetical protein
MPWRAISGLFGWQPPYALLLCVKALGLHAHRLVVACLSLIVPSAYGIAARPDSLTNL